MTSKPNPEWSKSYQCLPVDNIISHRYSKSRPFIPSYEKKCCPVDMNLLLGWEYSRIWEREHNCYIQARKESEKIRVIKRAPYKKPPKKTETKADRFKMKKFQDVGSRVSGKKSKRARKSGRTGGGGGQFSGNGKQGAGLNVGYGDIVTGDVKDDGDPIGPIPDNEPAYDNAQTMQDVKYMQQEIKRQYPQTYIDPNQYLGGVPIDDAEARDICKANAQMAEQNPCDVKVQC